MKKKNVYKTVIYSALLVLPLGIPIMIGLELISKYKKNKLNKL